VCACVIVSLPRRLERAGTAATCRMGCERLAAPTYRLFAAEGSSTCMQAHLHGENAGMLSQLLRLPRLLMRAPRIRPAPQPHACPATCPASSHRLLGTSPHPQSRLTQPRARPNTQRRSSPSSTRIAAHATSFPPLPRAHLLCCLLLHLGEELLQSSNGHQKPGRQSASAMVFVPTGPGLPPAANNAPGIVRLRAL
jgi:hypothetical protein